jgi:hypothetical protein
MFNLTDETEALMHYLQDRGLTPGEACAAMGLSITCLISDKKKARGFVRTLARQLEERAQVSIITEAKILELYVNGWSHSAAKSALKALGLPEHKAQARLEQAWRIHA